MRCTFKHTFCYYRVLHVRNGWHTYRAQPWARSCILPQWTLLILHRNASVAFLGYGTGSSDDHPLHRRFSNLHPRPSNPLRRPCPMTAWASHLAATRRRLLFIKWSLRRRHWVKPLYQRQALITQPLLREVRPPPLSYHLQLPSPRAWKWTPWPQFLLIQPLTQVNLPRAERGRGLGSRSGPCREIPVCCLLFKLPSALSSLVLIS